MNKFPGIPLKAGVVLTGEAEQVRKSCFDWPKIVSFRTLFSDEKIYIIDQKGIHP